MKLKVGVRLGGVRPEIVVAMMVADQLWRERAFSNGCTVTSVVDGSHSTYSRHYWGGAFDIRIWGLNANDILYAMSALKTQLGADFNVVQEHDHIHVGWRPKR